MIFHNQNWCAHTRHTIEPILLELGRKKTTFMKYLSDLLNFCSIVFSIKKIFHINSKGFYTLSLQNFIYRLKLSKNVGNFAFFLLIQDSLELPPSIFKIRNVNTNLNLQNSSFRSIKIIFHNQNWCTHNVYSRIYYVST